MEGTKQKEPLATWKVVEDDSAISGKKVLALTSPNHDSSGTFNICWTDVVSFLNGEIKVRFKANTGRVDQGEELFGELKIKATIILRVIILWKTISGFISSKKLKERG